MNFANTEGDLEVKLDKLPEKDLIKILFSENPGVLIQVKDRKAVEKILEEAGVGYAVVGHPCSERHILVSKDGAEYLFGIDHLRVYGSHHHICSVVNKADEAQAKAVSSTIKNSRCIIISVKVLPERWNSTAFRPTVVSRRA